jgi:hypothetical protein
MVGRAVSAVNARVGLRALIWAALLAAFALVLDFVPLFDVLGYDFSFALGLAAALMSVDVGQGVALRWRRTAAPASAPPPVLRLVARACGIGLALLVVPLLLSLASALRVRNCAIGYGLGFFALLPVATVLFAAPAGLLVGLAVQRPRRARLVAFALPVVSIAWTLVRLYRDPAVFAFDPFGGYFPGPIYDEALRPPLRLLYFRLVNLAWIATAVAIGAAVLGRGWRPRGWRLAALAVAAPLAAGSLALFLLEGPLGFHVRAVDLERALDRQLRTEHFVLHYASGAGKTHGDLALEARELEFRYQQLRATLGVEPRLPVTVWEFPSAELKKSLVGAGQTLFAKPWTREIFVQSEHFPPMRLRHEMVHVFESAFGDRMFGAALVWRWHGPVPLPVLASGLIEGVAEAADSGNPDGPSTVHQEAAAMVADGRAPPVAAVVGAGFSTLAGPRAYTVAGSFCAFLLTTRGAEPLRRLYHSAGDFTAVYKVPLATLEGEWRRFLAAQPLDARERAHAHEQFRRPAIFKKVCARELAARLGEARAIEHADPARAVALLEETCHDDPDEPIYRMALADARAQAGDGAAALAELARLQASPAVTEPLLARAANLAAEIHFHAGDVPGATADLGRVLELATDDADRRLATAKLRALGSAEGRATLGRALFGDELGEAGSDQVLMFFLMSEYARLFPADPLGSYLVGRQLVTRDPTSALSHLDRACGAATGGEHGGSATLTPEITRECHRLIAEAGYRAGDLTRARAAATRVAAESTVEAERLRARDWVARIDWAAARR